MHTTCNKEIKLMSKSELNLIQSNKTFQCSHHYISYNSPNIHRQNIAKKVRISQLAGKQMLVQTYINQIQMASIIPFITFKQLDYYCTYYYRVQCEPTTY